jgi:gamma-glutamyltranspeptidase/glutathione hydrolase
VPFSTRPELVGDFGMVASTHWLASSTGMSVLERGGNAADAAVAAAFVLNVVEPHLNGPGGEVPILLWDPQDEKVVVIAGQGTMPQAATIAHYRDLGLDLVPGTGLLAATVPGAMGAWLLLLERWGTWSVRDVLEPALALAEQGWPVLPAVTSLLNRMAPMFTQDWKHSAVTWLRPDGSAPPAGSRMRNPELAATWRRLIAEAEAGAGGNREREIKQAEAAFYTGFVAEAIEEHTGNAFLDSSGNRHAGVLTAADLAGWSPSLEEPVTFDYHGLTVCKTGPWAQGPVFLQQLALLAGFDLTDAGHLSADFVHTVIESAKLAFADREAWYGDPRDIDVPLEDLLSAGYNDERRALIGVDASLEFRPGSPGGRTPVLPRYTRTQLNDPGDDDPDTDPDADTGGVEDFGAATGEPTVAMDGTTRGDTCHLDVVDSTGMMISATPSGGWLQSSPTVPGLGFCLNSRAQMTWLEPGLASSLRPGMRPRTTLSPSMALRDGRPYLAFGTPGGDQQDQWTLLFFLAHVHFGLNLQQAIDAPTFHSLHFPESFWPRTAVTAGVMAEGRVAPDVVAELRRRGHRVNLTGDYVLGRIGAVGRLPDSGFVRAAADPRSAQAYAVGR